MNERIRKLAEQAEDYADHIVDHGGDFHPAYTEKLAELIARECAYLSFSDDNDRKSILKHFGITE